MLQNRVAMDSVSIKQQFGLDDSYIHLALCMLASHPHCVQTAINAYQQQLNRNPALFYRNKDTLNEKVLLAAADYLGCHPSDIALTNSTTEGLSLVYMGFRFCSGDEVLTSTHDHYASDRILLFKSKHIPISIKKIKLYENPQEVTVQEIIENIKKNISSKTRLLALTWVHSCTGVKLPLKEIRMLLDSINSARSGQEKIIFSIDAVHGFGVENFIKVEDLGCDFFITGCHKWLHGPRGTGLVWGNEQGWTRLLPISASFDLAAFLPWRKKEYENNVCPPARLCTPGGFPNFEHRWALADAFYFNLRLGKVKIQQKISTLATLCKQRLKRMPGIKLYTPLQENLSSGFVCFDVLGWKPEQVVEAMLEENIMVGQTPYRNSCLRIAPGIINEVKDIDITLQVLQSIIEDSKKG